MEEQDAAMQEVRSHMNEKEREHQVNMEKVKQNSKKVSDAIKSIQDFKD